MSVTEKAVPEIVKFVNNIIGQIYEMPRLLNETEQNCIKRIVQEAEEKEQTERITELSLFNIRVLGRQNINVNIAAKDYADAARLFQNIIEQNKVLSCLKLKDETISITKCSSLDPKRIVADNEQTRPEQESCSVETEPDPSKEQPKKEYYAAIVPMIRNGCQYYEIAYLSRKTFDETHQLVKESEEEYIEVYTALRTAGIILPIEDIKDYGLLQLSHPCNKCVRLPLKFMNIEYLQDYIRNRLNPTDIMFLFGNTDYYDGLRKRGFTVFEKDGDNKIYEQAHASN